MDIDVPDWTRRTGIIAVGASAFLASALAPASAQPSGLAPSKQSAAMQWRASSASVGDAAGCDWAEGFGRPGLYHFTGDSRDAYASVVFNDGTGDALYVGGYFFTGPGAWNIAKWDGTAWRRLGEGMNGTVRALTVFDDGNGPALYAGGDFTTADGVFASYVAKWDGNAWSVLGGGMNGDVSALTVFDDGDGPALYAGGFFTTAGGAAANYLARWDGTAWSALGIGTGTGTGVPHHVRALAVFDDGSGPALYAGGWFTSAAGAAGNYVARWDGTAWSALGTGTNNRVRALTVFDDGGGPALYAGGWFTSAGGAAAVAVAKWDGTAWSALGSGLTDPVWPVVFALTVFDDGSGPALYAGGEFSSAGGVAAGDIAKWDGTSWSALGTGELTGHSRSGVHALTVFDDGGGPALFVGGVFSRVDASRFRVNGLLARGIARWDGSAWSALGSGLDQFSTFHRPDAIVYALKVFDDGDGPALYAGGTFDAAGGVFVGGIAKWDGASWSALKSGMHEIDIDIDATNDVRALTVFDDGNGPGLYAGGDFTVPGIFGRHGVAKWDGTTWSKLGSGIDGSCSALTVFDDGSGPALYVGGKFTTAGGVPARTVAKWDGTAWSAFGTGMNRDVNALAVFDDGGGPALYAGGEFTTAGGVPARYVAKWDGTDWSALETAMNGGVNALMVFDDGGGRALYAGGRFSNAGNVLTVGIARWDGSVWSALGTGFDDPSFRGVNALATFDDGSGPALYAGGAFESADGVSARRIAKWDGTTWSALSFGMSSTVHAFTVFDDGGGPALYAGGEFQFAGSVHSSCLAKWQCSDCNGNGVRDDDDLADCDGSAWCDDCNGNGRLDECDAAVNDANTNDIPDVCECPPIATAPAAPNPTEVMDASGSPWITTSNRFLIFEAGEPGRSQAIRVTPLDLPPPFESWIGASQWVSAPSLVSNAAGTVNPLDDADGASTFQAAQLECPTTPHCMDWSTVGPIHVFGEAIMPSRAASDSPSEVDTAATYAVEVIDCVCDRTDNDSYSAPLVVVSPVWGDTVFDLVEDPPLPPDGPLVDVLDAVAIIERFSNAPGAISKARADLYPACIDLLIDVGDVLSALEGLAGMDYSPTPTADDPCDSACPNVLPRTTSPPVGPYRLYIR